MKPTLQQLYNGELCPCKTIGPRSEEYLECCEELEENCERFSQRLKTISPELESIFSGLIASVNVLRSMEAEEIFCQSFAMGVKLLTEALY